MRVIQCCLKGYYRATRFPIDVFTGASKSVDIPYARETGWVLRCLV